MKSIASRLAPILLAACTLGQSRASISPRLSLKDQVTQAAAICRGTVVQVRCFRDETDGAIKTEALVKVDEALKGRFPAVVRLVYDGGTLDGHGQQDGLSPRLRPGEQRLFLLARRTDGNLGAVDGFSSAILLTGVSSAANDLLEEVRKLSAKGAKGSDVTDQAADWSGTVPSPPISAMDATGLLVDSSTGVPSRYVLADRGEPIEYIVDAQTLPAGLTLDQCLGAATNAFAAWSAVTGITFKFAGLQNFGQASANVSTNDQRIRVQFHDLYNYISSNSTLGRGGRQYSYLLIFQSGGEGGKVVDQEFYANTCGFVVLNHRAPDMQTLSTFEEVLCHEIGHALGLAHSSENPNESNFVLSDAIMYYTAHADGRGARLGAYDPPVVQKVHPPNNTPPYGYNRVMDIVTATPQPNVAGINSVELAGYDLQNDNLTISLSFESGSNGSFSLQGNVLKYTAAGDFGNISRIDPSDVNSAWDDIIVRYSDGINASPYYHVRVLSYSSDTQPATSDGIPDNWAQQYFGSAVPTAANLSRAGDDKDGDGLTNLQEWLAGTDPTLAGSRLAIDPFNGATVQFTARPYDLYELMGSSDLKTWTRVGNPLLPTSASASFSGIGGASGYQFFQVRRAP